jgi:uncharacterized protein YodC (DUF2158 family)
MAETFKRGDVVRLKSGGPEMTVKQEAGDPVGLTTVWCEWFAGDKLEQKPFEPECLEMVH